MMNILVCIKYVILHAPEGRVVRTPDVCQINPFDRHALEVALVLKEQYHGRVTALSMGPKSAEDALFEAMAMGVDRGVLLCDPSLAGSDTLATSTALAALIKKLAPYDLVLFGTRTADSDTGQVGPQTAVMLDIPFVGSVYSVKPVSQKLIVERSADGFQETYEAALPAALSIHQRAAQPRDLALVGIESAFSESRIETLSLVDIGLRPDQVGLKGSGTELLTMSRVKRERKCEFIQGNNEEQAQQLLDRLLNSGLIG